MNDGGPPKRWATLGRWVLKRLDATYLADELALLHQRRLAEDGPRKAASWYRREVAALLWQWVAVGPKRLGNKMEGMMGDGIRTIGLSARSLLRAPAFTAITVFTLALGVGSLSLIVGIADRALFRELPFPEPDRLVSVLDGWGTSPGALEILTSELSTVSAIGAAINAEGVTLDRPGADATRISAARLTPGFMQALGVVPTLGRLFQPEEFVPGAEPAVLLGHDFWTTEFGQDPALVGQTLILDGSPHRVAGVLPRGFDVPTAHNDVWRTVAMDGSDPGYHWGAGAYRAIARLAPSATPDDLRAELVGIQDEVRLANPLWTPNPGFWDEAKVVRLQEARASFARDVLVALFAAVGLVLLVVCANAASLFLARGLSKRGDVAVRAALGASRGQLARDQLLEAGLIGILGLGVGIVAATAGLRALSPLLPTELPGITEVGIDLRVIGLTALVALPTTLLAGLASAFRNSRLPANTIRNARAVGSSGSNRLTQGLVITQLAAAVVLVTSAGLLARSMIEMAEVDPGFRFDDVATAEIHLPAGTTDDPITRASAFDQVANRISSIAGVGGSGLASSIPFGPTEESVALWIEGVTDDPNDLPLVHHHRVTPEVTEVLGLELLNGRGLANSDQVGTPLVAVVDDAFVREYFGGEPAVGRVIRYPWRGAPDIQIVGVVSNVIHGDLTELPEPTVWVPFGQMGMGALDHAFVLAAGHRSGDTGNAAPETILRQISQEVLAAGPGWAISDQLTFAQRLSESLAEHRLITLLLSLFAGVTLVLGSVGIYGVVSYAVRSRMREFGVRKALGAADQTILRQVFGSGLRLVLPGTALGLLLTAPAGSMVREFMFNVGTADPVTLFLVPIVLLTAGVLAAFLPARRATRVDAMTVLRDE